MEIKNVTYQFSVPSKTFLLGEYVALKDGPSIILTTEPRFKLSVTNHVLHAGVEGIETKSPTGKLIVSDSDFYQDYYIQFIDPHDGRGGFGASGAQFVMISALKNFIQKKTLALDSFDLLTKYLKFAHSKQGAQPSGADLIAQLHGQICFFHKSARKIKTYSWPFADLEYCLIHTGSKIATHKHLQTLKHLDITEMEKIVHLGLVSLEKGDDNSFIEAVRLYANVMQSQNLVAEKTNHLLKKLTTNSNILAAKGCGGLGADVILILFDKKKQDAVISWIRNKKLHIVAYGREVASGLDIQSGLKKDADRLTYTTDKIILVDPEDRKIGEMEKIHAHESAMLHRAFSVFIFRKTNEKIELLLQQRGKKKYHTAGLWTNTCCSHPHPGDDLVESAKMRLKGEMGIDAELKYVGKFHYVAQLENGLTENEIDHVMIGTYDADHLSINKEEVEDYRWVDVDMLQHDLAINPKKYTPWFKQAFDLALTAFKLERNKGGSA